MRFSVLAIARPRMTEKNKRSPKNDSKTAGALDGDYIAGGDVFIHVLVRGTSHRRQI